MPEYNNEIGAVLLNLGIGLTLSVIGILIFVIFWLRNDWYKLPDFEHGKYEKIFDQPFNKFIPYLIALWHVIREENSQLFINRFGFEYFFYLQFHRKMAINFVMCFFAICLCVLGFSLTSEEGNGFAIKRIIGIYYQGSKNHPILNTVIMTVVTLISTLRLRKMLLWFQSTLSWKANDIRQNPHYEYHFIINTALLYGGNIYDDDQKALLPYLRRMIKDNRLKAMIVQHSSPPDHVQLAKVLTDIDETIIYWQHSWFLKHVGWLIHPTKYKNQKTVDEYISTMVRQRDFLIAAQRMNSGYTFLLFSTVDEIYRFQKLLW